MYSEHGLLALIRPSSGQVCHSLIVVSYCTPGSAQAQAAMAIEAPSRRMESWLLADRKPVVVDPKRLRQAVTNIVGNASKFTAQGSVRVRAEATKSRIIVRVTDTGPGIAEAAQRMLFRDFSQAGDERLQRGGTGLGLVIAKRIVELHGGRVRLESRVGAGTTVTLELPIREAPASDIPGKRRHSRRPRSRRP
jgi:signal transduction histidine kinase